MAILIGTVVFFLIALVGYKLSEFFSRMPNNFYSIEEEKKYNIKPVEESID